MLAEAAEIFATGTSKNNPRTYGDYREMLKEKDLDIVLIATPDHWHALPMIAAVEAGADVYVQKPISVDVTEGQAMLAAARKDQRVVQVGTQRRSTPHLIEARDRIIREGKLGKIGLVEICCYYHIRNNTNPPDTAPPDYLDWDMWTGPAPMRPYNSIAHPRGWRIHGIRQRDRGRHVHPHARHGALDARPRLAQEDQLDGRHPGGQGRQGEYPRHPDGHVRFRRPDVVWQHRTWGDPVDPKYPWGATFYGDKGTLKASVLSYDFIPLGEGTPIHRDVTYEFEQYPEDHDEKELEKHVAPAISGHMKDLLAAIASRGPPVADIEQGYISTTSCILANLSLQLGRSLTWDPQTGKVAGDDEANIG